MTANRRFLSAAIIIVVAFGITIAAWLAGAPTWDGVERDLAARYPDVARITADELLARLSAPRPPVLLDVRTADEYAVSHLPGARRVEPGSSDVTGVATDDDVVVYCAVGERSCALAAQLARRGQRQVADLRGGIFAWANAGLPLERDGGAARGVHPYDRRWGRLLERSRWRWTPSD